MIEKIIQLDTAKLAKEKGFDIPTNFYFGMYGKLRRSKQKISQKSLISIDYSCIAPSQSILQKWLRDKHKIHIQIHNWEFEYWYYYIFDSRDTHTHRLILMELNPPFEFKTYEEALEKGLIDSLNLI